MKETFKVRGKLPDSVVHGPVLGAINFTGTKAQQRTWTKLSTLGLSDQQIKELLGAK